MNEFDVVVVGGGSAGCVLAGRLSENPECSVCLVEAGPDYGPHDSGRWPADMLNACELAFSHSWERHDPYDRSQLRARILGGCSAHNACAVLPGAPSDYDEWGPGWTAAEFEPYLTRAASTIRTRRFAGTVVLAAGAYGSPAILLRSAIGPESAVPIGENLVDHPGVGAGWDATERLQAETTHFAQDHPVFMGGITFKARSRSCPQDLWDLHVFPATEPGKDELGHPTGSYELSAAVFALKPHSRGRVTLADPDPRTPPIVEHGFLSDPRDVSVLLDGLELLRRLGSSVAMNTYSAGEVRPGLDVDPEAYVRKSVRGYFHPVGTCALGSVVDGSGRVLGFDNLYVGDASVMPTIPRANTNLSTLAVAEKIAEGITSA